MRATHGWAWIKSLIPRDVIVAFALTKRVLALRIEQKTFINNTWIHFARQSSTIHFLPPLFPALPRVGAFVALTFGAASTVSCTSSLPAFGWVCFVFLVAGLEGPATASPALPVVVFATSTGYLSGTFAARRERGGLDGSATAAASVGADSLAAPGFRFPGFG